MILRLGGIIVVWFFLFSGTGFGAFQYLDVGARPLGMAGAFTASGGDINSVQWNPAGLAQLDERQLTAMYSKLFPDLEDSIALSFLAYGQPTALANFGISGIIFGSELYSEQIYSLTAAKNLGALTEMMILNDLSVGINLKYLLKKYGQNAYTVLDPTFVKGYGADGYSIDAGLMYSFHELVFGFSGKNINQPDVHIYKKDIVPAEYRAGFFYSIFETGLYLDYAWMNNANRDKRYLFGAERWFFGKRAAVRGGVGYGNNEYAKMGLGASYVVDAGITKIELDYAYEQMTNAGASDMGGKHIFSLTMKF